MKRFITFILIFISYCTKAETISLATTNWPPYISKNMKNYGPVAEIIRKAFSVSGVEVKFIFAPWARSLNSAEKGLYDGIMPEYYDKDRLDNFYFSDPFFSSKVGLFKHDDLKFKFTGNYKELRNYSIAIVRGYVNTEQIDNSKELKKVVILDDVSSLKMLSKRRVDFSFMDKYVGYYLLSKNRAIKNLTFMRPPLEEKRLYVAFSKKSKRAKYFLKYFNHGLKVIRKDIPSIIKKYPSFN